jgi:hypothetical protein
MSWFPDDAAARTKRRKELRAAAIAEAERKAREVSRSIRCGRFGDHRKMMNGEYYGCANDGSNCICECHDGQRDTTQAL